MISKHVAIWLLTLAVPTGLSGCPRQLRRPQGRPAWLVAGSDNSYPPGRFLFAAGSGPSSAAAERAAAAKMAHMQKELLEQVSEKLSGYRVANSLVVAGRDLESLLELLPRPQPGPRWSSSDGTRHAAALVVDKQRAAAGLLERVTLLENTARRNLEKARRHLQADEISPALGSALLALAGNVQALRLGALAGVLADKKPPPPAGLAGCSRLLLTLLDSLEARTVRGNRQWLDNQGRLQQPLVAGVYVKRGKRTFPASNLPVLFSPPPPAQPLHGVTNDVGLSIAELPALAITKQQQLPVSFGLDAGSLMAFSVGRLPAASAVFDGLRRRLGRTLASFSLMTAGKQAPRFLVLIEEHRAAPGPNMRFTRALEEELSSKGFRPVQPGQMAADLAMSETTQEYAEVTRGHVEVLISGQVAISTPARLSKNFVLCRVEAHLDVLAPARPATVKSIVQQAESAGLDRRSACRRARTRLVKQAGQAVLQAATVIMGEQKP